MSLPLVTLAERVTPDGTLRLQQRGDHDFFITLDHRVLMSSGQHRSEVALGALACRDLRRRRHPRVLLGGLGMAYTLRAVLDALPPDAEVVVAELNPVIVDWCRGPIAHLTGGAVRDPRVTVRIDDFAEVVRAAAPGHYDAVIIDLYVGPDGNTPASDPLYGRDTSARAFAALRPGGVFAIWAEAFHPPYDKRLQSVGFDTTHERPARGAGRFVVYLATRPVDAAAVKAPRRQTPPAGPRGASGAGPRRR